METEPNSNVDFELNAQQSDLFLADTDQFKTILGLAGEQSGKTTVAVLWLRKEVDKFWDVGPFNYIVGSNSYKVLKQSTKEKFDEVFTSYMGHYNHKEDFFQLMKEGNEWGKIFFRSQGMDKKSAGDSFIGIPDCRAGLGDEVAKWQRQFYIRFRGRLGRLNGPFFGCGTPYAMNFIKKELVDRFDNGDPSILYRRWTCMDNPSYDKSGIEILRQTLTKTEFERLVLGILTKPSGLVHQQWGKGNYVPRLPGKASAYIGSIDWGFDHPAAIIITGVYGSKLIIESITKIRHLGPDQMKSLILAKHALFQCKIWSAGHDQPGMISDLSAKIPIQKYFENLPHLREVNPGDQKVSEMIQTLQLQVLEGISQLEDFEDEIETYRWDREDDEDPKDKPVDNNNDLMAALRYNVIGALSMGQLKVTLAKYVDTRDRTQVDLFRPKKKQNDWTDS